MSLHNIEECFTGSTLFVGVGNIDRSDDGFGVHLCRSLIMSGLHEVIETGTTPENWMEKMSDTKYQNVVFLDAVLAGQESGSAVFLDAATIKARYPQISTHKISLGTLARVIEERSGSRVWLIGVQPMTAVAGGTLSVPVQASLNNLLKLITAHVPSEVAC